MITNVPPWFEEAILSAENRGNALTLTAQQVAQIAYEMRNDSADREPSARQLAAGREILREFDPDTHSAHQAAERVWRAMIAARRLPVRG